MEHLAEISVADLQAALDRVEGKRPTQRLLAAIAAKHGITQTDLADWYGVERKTIYNWLTRFDDVAPDPEALAAAATNAPLSGRTRKLSPSEQNEFERTVRNPPGDAGYDAPAWTPALARRHIEETYGVEYSLASCRRLLKEAGLTYQKPRRRAAEADPADRERFAAELKKSERSWTPR